MYFGCMDWNGDGKMDSFDLAYELGVIRNINDGVEAENRELRIRAMVDAINRSGYEHIGNEEFEELCGEIRVSPAEFEQEDIEEIKRRLGLA